MEGMKLKMVFLHEEESSKQWFLSLTPSWSVLAPRFLSGCVSVWALMMSHMHATVAKSRCNSCKLNLLMVQINV